MNSDLYPGTYLNSSELARATPHVRLSRPTPPDNTEWFDHDHQIVKEPARVALCFDCQQPIEAGKGIQVQRHLSGQILQDGYGGTPCEALVHPTCNQDPYVALANACYKRLA